MLTADSSPLAVRRPQRRVNDRRGAILILMVAILIALMAVLGLVIDAGLLMAQARQAQNVADAAAVSAARDLLEGFGSVSARQTATAFITSIHGFKAPAESDIRIPPQSGPYAGKQGYVEVTVRQDSATYFIGFLPGMNSLYTVSARSVAGFEGYSASEGVMALNSDARPGLSLGGSCSLRVNGRVLVNSEGGGEDEFGNPINNGNNGVAASGGQPNSEYGIFARKIRVVGGVDNSENFKPYVTSDPAPLMTRILREPDPLITLPVPVASLGVDNRQRGSVTVNNTNILGINSDNARQNRIARAGESVAGGLYTAVGGEAVLHPGIYDSIDINGGNAIFIPGIYVVSAKFNNQSCLKITGGNVKAKGLLFYVTGSNYESAGGTPDINDGETPPPITDNAKLGSVTINASIGMSPIDTNTYNYASLYNGAVPVSSKFDGMLFFQRRMSTEAVSIGGNGSEGSLLGTLYAKWAMFDVTGQGTYDAQFIAGEFSLSGQGVVTIRDVAGGLRGRADVIYLVE